MLIQKNASLSRNIYLPPTKSEEEVARQQETEAEAEAAEGSDEETEEEKEKRRRNKLKPTWHWKPAKKIRDETILSTPIFQGVVEQEWQGVTFMMLDQFDAHSMKYSQAIQAALTTNKFHLALTLLRKITDSKLLKTVNKTSSNLFHVLCEHANPDQQLELQLRVAAMLATHNVSCTLKDSSGCTPLHYACLHKNLTLTKYILLNNKNVNLEEKDIYGRTALAAAFWGIKQNKARSMDLCKELIKRGAKLDILCDYPGTDLALFAYKSPQILDKYDRAYPTAKISPLMLAIINSDYKKTKLLIENKASINFPDSNGVTPIMCAVRMNNIHMVRLIMDASYDKDKFIDPDAESKAKSAKKTTPQKRKHGRAAFTLGRRLAKRKKLESDEEEEEEDEEEEEVEEKEKEAVAPSDVSLTYKKFPVKSEVDVNVVDIQGWTVIHHLVCPINHGTYDNVRLLKMLVDAGAPVQRQDKAGLAPLDYALIRGAPNLAKAIQKLQGKKRDTWERPTVATFEVNDGVALKTKVPDYKKDAELLLKELNAAAVEKEKDTVFIPEPDAQLELQGGAGEVAKDEEQDLHYDVLLTKIDVKAGSWGMYNFYKMQVVHQKGKDLYILFNRWGRIGDTGQFQRTPFPKKDDCVKEFCKIFKAKTGNAWNNYKSFENKPKKYRLVQSEQRKQGKRLSEVKYDLTSKVKSQLPEYIQDLMKELMDVTAMSKALHKCNVDEELMPLGRIKKDVLLKAKDILGEIKTLIVSVEKRREKVPVDDIEAYTLEMEQIANLSSEYYHLIPRSGYTYERVLPIDNENSLKSEWDHISTLLELEVATKMLAAAHYRRKEIHPFDYVYHSMECNMELMRVTDVESQYLLRYVHSSSPNTNVEAIFRISRPGEDRCLRQLQMENHKLLFHGSSTSNLISILKRGLLIAPPEAPTTGWAFGKGIYTADTFSKSEGYCYNWSSCGKRRFMLVCQVALGSHRLCETGAEPECEGAGCDSTLAVGRQTPDNTYDVTLPSGATIPLGDVIERPFPDWKREELGRWSWPFYNNEYIVYNESQIALRYIIQFK